MTQQCEEANQYPSISRQNSQHVAVAGAVPCLYRGDGCEVMHRGRLGGRGSLAFAMIEASEEF